MTDAPIEFFFDFSSPYGYLAATCIDDVAARHGRSVAWKPFLLGVAFKSSGSQPLVDYPLKGEYSRRDMARSARRLGVPFIMPEPFPFMAVAASRAFYWLDERDPAAAQRLAKALFHKAYAEQGEISSAAAVVEVARSLGIYGEALQAALAEPAVKDRLRREVEAAIGRGIFGSPFFIVDGELFWGHDRLGDVERWLETGGW
jgi:2-hydroxychromene-2-carboxylate isomerase